MRTMKGMIAGALALGSLVFAHGEASARPMAAPELINVAATQTGSAAASPTCHYGWRRHYGWHRHWGWHRPWGWHPYGWHRPWGWHHYGWHRPWEWHHGSGWHHRYGW